MAHRIYCLLLLKLEEQPHAATPCQVGMAVVAETNPAFACWRVQAQYPGARVLKILDITEVVGGSAPMASGLAPVEVDGWALTNLTRLCRVDGAEVMQA